MLDRLNESFAFYQNALQLRSQRQEVLASNIANADTPGYKARDFNFADELERANTRAESASDGLSLSLTSARHIPGRAPNNPDGVNLQYRVPAQPSLDGNTVDMDVERVKFLENSMHYQAGLQFLTGRLEDMQSALRPPA